MNGAFEVNLLSTGLKTAAMLLIVLAVLICVLYIMKRFLFFQKKSGEEQLIKVVSSMHLSPKERIQVVEISGERIVIGITPGSINFLARLSDGNERNE
ncbi:MAG: flagellar biosynthetic protein FliO [Proteobacteria bacterium]|nr:flagellar biosynthetic protein FliO [Pseudomonadota bacterium]MBU4011274.1 flagellar biosynthetic protein FliO [Pseudomonadota bacterium]MBU4036644.1 flagellar biosynthetic protein FliO [Pseudomonadota bacterium]